MYLDIETLPADDSMHDLMRQIHKKRVEDGKTTKTFEEVIEESGLNGAFGRICCIGFAINDDKAQTLCGPEEKMLQDFWAMAKNIDLFIGFNVMDFDLKFIYQRSIILQIKPSIELSFARYRSHPIYDILYEWAKWSGGVGSRISLDNLARAMGIPSSKGGEVEGKTVAKAYAEGKINLICDYCAKDVEVTRSIYKRMTFS